MRAVRLTIVLLIVSMIFMLALSDSRLARQPFAQVTAAPGPVPLTPPAAPGQPQAFSTIGALPALAPAPGFAIAPTAQPTPQVFRCTCSAPGTWTEWSGNVTSSNFLLARQSARSQCANFLLNANAPSAFIPLPGTSIVTQRLPLQTSVGQAGLRQRSSVVPLTTECSQCACN